MNLDPSPEQARFLDQVRAVARERVAPHAEAWDRGRRFPSEAVAALAAIGALGVYVPREHGGLGLDTVAYALAVEEISSVLPALGIILSVNNSLVANPIARFGTPEQKQTFLEPLAQGRLLGAFALTEAEAGSDATHIATRAVRAGDGYVLDGEKVMVTNGGPAGLFLVTAATDPEKRGRGLTAFLVPGDAPGVTRGPRDATLGLHSSDVRPVRFERVRLGAEHRLGEENHGFAVVLEAINAGRIGVGAQAVGIARGALDRALTHALGRRQFDQRVCDIPMVQQLIGETAAEVDAAWLTVLYAARQRDRGGPVAYDAARAKLAASEMCVRACSAAIQICGGWGYLSATGVERFYRDAKVTQLYEGTSEILRILVAGSLTRG
jgi:alkylation response protein AidB-like acyl-CoA dehydrogenase